MQKSMFITIIILATLVLIVGGYLGYKYYWQNRGKTTAEVVEIRDFSCPGMSEFTFKYPVFKGWSASVESVGSNECQIVFDHPDVNLYTSSKIVVKKISAKASDFWFEPEPGNIVKKANQNNVNYLEFPFRSDESQSVKFDIENNQGVVVTPMNIVRVSGFNLQSFFKTVIESFRLVQNDYQLLSKLNPTVANDKNAIEAVKQELKKDKESENDFYAKMKKPKDTGVNLIIVQLWDRKDYESNPPVLGNSSGKSRNMYYNSDLGKITKTEFWQ